MIIHTLISTSLTGISPSLTSILQALAWYNPSFEHLTIIEKLHRLLYIRIINLFYRNRSLSPQVPGLLFLYSRCIFSVLLKWVMLFKCEQMLLKCQHKYQKNVFLHPTYKMFRNIEILVLSFNHLNSSIYVCQFYNHFLLIILIALAHLHGTEKMHRLL